MFQASDLIHSYSRAEAIKDGLQVCVSELFSNDTRMYKYPVFFTAEVWKLCQGKGIIVCDICYMAAMASKIQKSNSPIVKYSVIVEEAERIPDFFEDTLPCYRLLAECGAKEIDDPAPAITIMFPNGG